MDRTEMRILGEIAADTDFISVPALATTLHQHRDDPEWTMTLAPVRFGFCTILSNCCDLEPRNGRIQAPAIVMARLRPIPADFKRNEQNFESLRANKDPRDPNDPGYIDFFYLEAHDLLQGHDWRIHFNQVVSLPTNDLAGLLGRKILQLDDRTRMKLKIKLGFTFMRPNTEELAAGLENPWREVPAS